MKKSQLGLAIVTQPHDLYEGVGAYSCQLAASIISKYGNYPAAVFEVAPDSLSKPQDVVNVCKERLGVEKVIFGFSLMRDDYFSQIIQFALDLKEHGYLTFLAGPSCQHRYLPEVEADQNPHGFQGHLQEFDFLYTGPAEGFIPVMDRISADEGYTSCQGITTFKNNQIIKNPSTCPNLDYLTYVNWKNTVLVSGRRVSEKKVSMGVVLGQWGCPYASYEHEFQVDPPAGTNIREQYAIQAYGCSFCSYGKDTGGKLYPFPYANISRQIEGLPLSYRKRKFWLSHQTPFAVLPYIVEANDGIKEIYIMSRADHLLNNKETIEQTLREAKRKKITIVAGAIGFESLLNKILRNFNKGITAEENLEAMELLVALDKQFSPALAIEVGSHGYICPTPWHTEKDLRWESANMFDNPYMGKFFWPSSIQCRRLKIAHTDSLADWLRWVEKESGMKYKRNECGVIEWKTEATDKWEDIIHQGVTFVQ